MAESKYNLRYSGSEIDDILTKSKQSYTDVQSLKGSVQTIQNDVSSLSSKIVSENKISFLYKATFKVDNWSGNIGNYHQTVSAIAVDGGPAITSSSFMTSGLFCDDTVQGDAQEALLEAASIVDKGKKSFGNATITCTLTGDKPTADAEVYFNAKKGGA